MKESINPDNPTIAEFIDFVKTGLFQKPTYQCHGFSLELLNEIEELFLTDHVDELSPLMSAVYAVLFGETIVRKVNGAEWVNLESQDLSDMTVVIRPPNNDTVELLRIRPILTINKFAQDHKHTMTSVYKLAETMSKFPLKDMSTFFKHKTN